MSKKQRSGESQEPNARNGSTSPAGHNAVSSAHGTEQSFRLLVQGVKDYAIFMLNREGRVTTWNAGAERINGYKAEEIIGQHFSRFYPSEAIESGWPQHELEAALKDGRFEDEGWRLRNDGSRFWANVIITAIYDDAGTHIGFGKVTRDLTERKRHEEALRESEERFRLMVEGVQDYAIFLLDVQGHVVTWNAGAERIKGYRASEIVGQHFSRFYTPDDVAAGKPHRMLTEAARQGRWGDIGWRVRKDGSRFWANVVITALRDAEGNLRGFSKITRDETERRRFEEMLRSVVDHVIDGIITIDSHGSIESFNPAAEKLFGYDLSEVIGKNVKMLMPQPYHGEHDGYIRNYLRTGNAKIIGTGREVVGRRKDGSTFPMELAVSEFTLGPRRFFTGIVRDITQRKQLEAELRQRLDDLAEGDRQKNEFLAMLAHELRNPLAPMRNALHLLKIPGVNASIATQARDMMERQMHQLVRLVDDLLDVSRIIRGKIDLRKEPVDLAVALARAVETAHPLIDAHGHKLELALPDQPVYVEGDLVRLSQVIANLLTNAAKYTEQAGQIAVAVESRGGQAVLRVHDTGIGIPPEFLPQIFDLFTQADRSLARSEGGLGIGLTLVKRLVEMHGGEIAAESAGVGKGSTFTICLPLLEAATEYGEAGPGAGSARVTDALRKRVLVVDDNVDAAESIAMVLRVAGYDVRCVYDGLSALEAAERYHPQVVVLDIGLPGMNGYDVARRLRAQPEFTRTPIIAVTGYGQDEDRRRSREAGFDAHLTKPVDPDALQAFVAASESR